MHNSGRHKISTPACSATRTPVSYTHLMVDGRVLDSDVPQGTDLKSYIHITPTSKAFSSCSNGDIWLDREASVDGSLTYSLTFNDITYLDTTAQDNTLSFDVSVINNSTPGAPIANLPLTSVSQSIGQCSKSKDETVTSGAKPTVMVKDSNYGGGNIACLLYTSHAGSVHPARKFGVVNTKTCNSFHGKASFRYWGME